MKKRALFIFTGITLGFCYAEQTATSSISASQTPPVNQGKIDTVSEPLVVQKATQKKRTLIDKVVARVNGNNILLSDLTKARIDREGMPYLMREMYDKKNKEEIRKGLKFAIDQELLFQKAIERKLLPTDIDIEKQIVSFKAMQNLSHLSEEEFEKELRMNGITLEDYRNQLRRVLAIEKLRHTESSERIIVTDEEIENYYYKHRAFLEARYSLKIATFDASLFSKPPKKMDLLRRNDLKWEVFPQLEKSQISEHLSFAFTMKKGEVSKPVLKGSSYQLVMLVDREEARYKTLDEQSIEAEKVIKEEKRAHFIQNFLKELRSQAIIIYLEPLAGSFDHEK